MRAGAYGDRTAYLAAAEQGVVQIKQRWWNAGLAWYDKYPTVPGDLPLATAWDACARSDSTSRAAWTGSSSSVCNSPSTRTDGRDSDERYRVDAPRAADTRSNRSRPETVGSEGGGSPDRIGCWKIGPTTAGGDVTTATGCEGGATSGGDGSTATG